jgi:hypothetical protein
MVVFCDNPNTFVYHNLLIIVAWVPDATASVGARSMFHHCSANHRLVVFDKSCYRLGTICHERPDLLRYETLVFEKKVLKLDMTL